MPLVNKELHPAILPREKSLSLTPYQVLPGSCLKAEDTHISRGQPQSIDMVGKSGSFPKTLHADAILDSAPFLQIL